MKFWWNLDGGNIGSNCVLWLCVAGMIMDVDGNDGRVMRDAMK